jgi:hypothetical protein
MAMRLIPLVGTELVKFGMTQYEVRSILGEPKKSRNIEIDNRVFHETYFKPPLEVLYLDAICQAVQVYPYFEPVEILGQNPFQMSYTEALSWLLSEDPNTTCSNRGGYLISPKLQLSCFVLKEGRKIKNVCISTSEYRSHFDALMEMMFDGMQKEKQNLLKEPKD